jgi:molybdenum cofactor cytidylyltransferase
VGKIHEDHRLHSNQPKLISNHLMNQRPRIVAVVLAAGGSSRLGRPKQLLNLGNRPLMSHTLDAVREAGNIDARFLVLGHASEEIQKSVDLDGFTVIDNPDYAEGQSTSVRCAIEFLGSDTDAVIFVLADQPLQVPAVIDRLSESYRQKPSPVVQPVYADGPGNPILIARPLFPELAKLSGDTGARPVLQQRKSEIRRIDCQEWTRPLDVDSDDDYQRIVEQYQNQSQEPE